VHIKSLHIGSIGVQRRAAVGCRGEAENQRVKKAQLIASLLKMPRPCSEA